jgi:hypothetical protein
MLLGLPSGSPGAMAASGAFSRGAGLSPSVEVLVAPPVAWQPAPVYGTLVPVPGLTFSVPSWHSAAAAATAAAAAQYPSSSFSSSSSSSPFYPMPPSSHPHAVTLAGGGGPPRAARSPADLRSSRLLVYFLSNLRYADASTLFGTTGNGEESVVGGGGVEDGDDDGMEAAAGGDAGEDEEVEDEEDEEDEGLSVGAPEEDLQDEETAGGDGDGDGDGDGETSDEEAVEDEEVEVEEAVVPGDDAPATLRGPLSALSAAEASVLHSRLVRQAALETFWAVLSDLRVARTCARGLASPAWHARHALALRVPAADLWLCEGPSDLVPVPLPAGGPVPAARLAALEGQLVGLCSSSTPPAVAMSHAASAAAVHAAATPTVKLALALQAGADPMSASSLAARPPPATTGGSGAAPTLVPAPCLPCLGLGYVRRVDRATGVLHILTPLPVSLAARVDVLVPWSGAHDLPPPLLFQSAPEGDPFCFEPRTILSTSAGKSSKGGTLRKNLKRRRLGGGGGGGGRNGGR